MGSEKVINVNIPYLWQVRSGILWRIPFPKEIRLRVPPSSSPSSGCFVPILRCRYRQHGIDTSPQVILCLIDQRFGWIFTRIQISPQIRQTSSCHWTFCNDNSQLIFWDFLRKYMYNKNNSNPPWNVTLDRILLGIVLEILVEGGRGWTWVGEDGIDDQVGRGVEVATGILHVSKDAAVALHECLREGPPTTSKPGEGIEVNEPRYRLGYKSVDKRHSQGLGSPVPELQRGQYPAGEPRDSRRTTSGVRIPQTRVL